MRSKFRRSLALLLALLAPASASAGECAIAPSIPPHLMSATAVADYRSILRVCRGPGGEGVATREMRIEGEAARGYVIIDRDAGRMTMVMTDQRQHTEHESDPGMPPGIPAGGNPPSR